MQLNPETTLWGHRKTNPYEIEDPYNLKENHGKLHIYLIKINVNTVVRHHKQMRYQTIAIQNLARILTMIPPIEWIKLLADFSSKKTLRIKILAILQQIIISPPGLKELQFTIKFINKSYKPLFWLNKRQ